MSFDATLFELRQEMENSAGWFIPYHELPSGVTRDEILAVAMLVGGHTIKCGGCRGEGTVYSWMVLKRRCRGCNGVGLKGCRRVVDALKVGYSPDSPS